MTTVLLDASSPVGVDNNSLATSLTTASFTPPSLTLLVAVVTVGSNIGAAVNAALSDSLGGVWTTIVSPGAGVSGPGAVLIATRNARGNGSAMTVTATMSGTDPIPNALGVFVLDNTAASQAGAAIASLTTSTSFSTNVTPSAVGSLILVGCEYGNNNYALTAVSGNTSLITLDSVNYGQTLGVASLTTPTSSLSPVSMGYTQTGAGAGVRIGALEILYGTPPPPASTGGQLLALF